jgi:hypothetical protein
VVLDENMDFKKLICSVLQVGFTQEIKGPQSTKGCSEVWEKKDRKVWVGIKRCSRVDMIFCFDYGESLRRETGLKKKDG